MSTSILSSFLSRKSARFQCRLVQHHHAKVIWWREYGLYIGSANLTQSAWYNNVEAGCFFPEAEITDEMAADILDLFEVLDRNSTPLTDELLAVMQSRAKRIAATMPSAEEFWKSPSIKTWPALSYATKKNSSDRQRKEFLEEWHATLQLLRDIREAFPEIERPGVYILIGADEDAQDRQLAYIGESEGVGARLSYHNSNEAGRDAKGFWTDTVVLISKDENLTKSHARYVEACLIRGVVSNPRWTLPNTRTPSDDAGKLPLPDRAAMDEFVDQTKTLVGALGWDLFREVRGRAQEQIAGRELPEAEIHESPRFFFRGDGFAAEMEIGPSGDFVVTAGSRARVRTTRTIPRGTVTLRNTLVEKGVLREEGDFLVFTSAYSFTSASAAAAAVIGASANGRILWKLPDGRNYADWEASQGISDCASQ